MQNLGKKIVASGFGAALAMSALLVPTAANAQVAPVSAASDPIIVQPLASYVQLVKCQIINYAGGTNIVGTVVGYGSGNTYAKAQAAARAEANSYLHTGEYTRHCVYSADPTKWRLGVDRF